MQKSEMLAGQHPPLACRPSPPQGGRLDVTAASPTAYVGGRAPSAKLPISLLAGEMAGRPEGGCEGTRRYSNFLSRPVIPGASPWNDELKGLVQNRAADAQEVSVERHLPRRAGAKDAQPVGR
ncbi:MAG: hypothetical protein EOQ30_11895 [Mesorhizobium sp.]|nr:MAG: hypothetical protein EOQ29_10090 [Mesorhizobium sp.]RWA84028.1 MAG: hypothetical protein EOQ30_11895 [Mesorhizobium sp.]